MSLYDELGVAPTASQEEIRRAYVELARRYHPDVGGSAARMRVINDAWSVLGDPRRRSIYDRASHTNTHGTSTTDAGRIVDDGETSVRLEDLLEQWAANDPRPLAEPPPRWLAMVPPALFAAAVVMVAVGTVVSDSWILGCGLVLFALSIVAVVAVTMLTMKSSIRSRHR